MPLEFNDGAIFSMIDIRSTGVGPGQIQVQGSNILFGGIVIGTSSGVLTSGGSPPIIVNLTSSATVNSIQALIRSFTFNQYKPKPVEQQMSVSYYPDRDNIVSQGSAHAYITVLVRRR